MPLHDTANILARAAARRHGRGPTEGLATEKAAPAAEELRTLQEQSAKEPALLERSAEVGTPPTPPRRCAAKKGLAQKPRSSRDRAEFDARTLKVEAPRAGQAAKRAEARCSLALKRLAVAGEGGALPGNLGRGPDQIDQIRRQREAARLSEEKIVETGGGTSARGREAGSCIAEDGPKLDLRDDADAEDGRVSRARGAAGYERACRSTARRVLTI